MSSMETPTKITLVPTEKLRCPLDRLPPDIVLDIVDYAGIPPRRSLAEGESQTEQQIPTRSALRLVCKVSDLV